MSFIETVHESEAGGDVAFMYSREGEPKGYVPNYVKAYSHRPDLYEAWRGLIGSVLSHMDPRLYELVTIAAARALRSSYCSIAHGDVFARHFGSPGAVTQIVLDPAAADVTDAERAAMRYAAKVARHATDVDQADIDELRDCGFSDTDIFDIASAVAARCFFSTLLDATGARPDAELRALDEAMVQTMTVGRPLAD